MAGYSTVQDLTIIYIVLYPYLRVTHSHAREKNPPSLYLGVDNVNESRLQASAAHEEAVNVLLLRQILAVLLAYAAAVDDARLVRGLLTQRLGHPAADRRVHFLRLLRGGDLAGADGPDGLVGHHDLAPVLDVLGDGAELGGDHLNGLAGDEVVGFLQDHSPLAVAQERPGDVAVLELLDRDLAREGAVGLVEDVLGGDLEARAEVLAGEEEVERGRGHNDFGVLVQLGLVQVLDNALDRVDGAVHLEVAADEELTGRHGCGVGLVELRTECEAIRRVRR